MLMDQIKVLIFWSPLSVTFHNPAFHQNYINCQDISSRYVDVLLLVVVGYVVVDKMKHCHHSMYCTLLGVA